MEEGTLPEDESLLSEQELEELEELVSPADEEPLLPCRFCPRAFPTEEPRNQHEDATHALHLGRS